MLIKIKPGGNGKVVPMEIRNPQDGAIEDEVLLGIRSYWG